MKKTHLYNNIEIYVIGFKIIFATGLAIIFAQGLAYIKNGTFYIINTRRTVDEYDFCFPQRPWLEV